MTAHDAFVAERQRQRRIARRIEAAVLILILAAAAAVWFGYHPERAGHSSASLLAVGAVSTVRRRKGDPLTRYEVDANGCWIWQGATHASGYGVIRIADDQNAYAHRFFYEHHIGPIPEGLTIDHLCRVHACVNPEHLEPVTLRENCQRFIHPASLRTHCVRGHAFDEANTYRNPAGRRECRACSRMRDAAYRARKAAA